MENKKTDLKVTREARAAYSLPFDERQLADRPLILERQGQPVAVVISPEEYRAYREWRDGNAWRQQELRRLEPERKAFQRLLPELLKTHRGQFVAIYEGQVIDADPDNLVLAQRVHALGYHPVYIQKVSPEPRNQRSICRWGEHLRMLCLAGMC